MLLCNSCVTQVSTFCVLIHLLSLFPRGKRFCPICLVVPIPFLVPLIPVTLPLCPSLFVNQPDFNIGCEGISEFKWEGVKGVTSYQLLALWIIVHSSA